jgi:DNA polymerase (family 10)
VVVNADIAARLRELARLTTLDDGSPQSFRVRAYERAARAVESAANPLTEMSDAQLLALAGVGKSTAAKIREIIATGSTAKLDELRGRYPPSFQELTRVPGIGPKTALLLRDRLGVESIGDLREALGREAIRDLPGLGAKTEENLVRALERLGAAEERTPIIDAMQAAGEVVRALSADPAVERAEVMGSLRRFRDTIGDVDIIAVSSAAEEVMRRFVDLPVVRDVVAYGARKSAIVATSGLQIDLRVIPQHQFGSASVYFTGSKAHNIRLRQLAIDRGWTLNEYGLSDAETGAVIASETEEEIYRALDLAWIPPPLREDAGEIELAAADALPDLPEVESLLGDLHVHTDLSGDGHDSLEAMVSTAAGRGYRYLAITDHGEDLTINGVSRGEMIEQRSVLRSLQEGHPTMTLLHGVELNIDPDGGVDYDPEFLAAFDWCLASVHSHFDLDGESETRRVVTAMRNPAVNAIGHLTGRLIGRRPGIDLDVDAVLSAAEETGTALEINCHLDRLDVPAEMLRLARDREVLFVISTDAHTVRELDQTRWGIRHAARGWVECDRVVNTWEPDRFLAWIDRSP